MAISIDHVQIQHVLAALRQQTTSCLLCEVARLCPELTDDQVFLAIDYLSRSGQVYLTRDADRTYWVKA
jgi:hypothetical protein